MPLHEGPEFHHALRHHAEARCGNADRARDALRADDGRRDVPHEVLVLGVVDRVAALARLGYTSIHTGAVSRIGQPQ